MKIIDVKQGSEEWLYARAGVVTASEMKNILTAKGEPRKANSDMVQSYLAKKLAEKWTGAPLPDLWGGHGEMLQGSILESQARPWYEFESGNEVKTVGFITTDDGRVGCSPDGLIGDKCGIEIKCPAMHTHVGYLLQRDVPDEYFVQVQASMWVTQRPAWVFMSYRIGFPTLLLNVEMNRDVQSSITESVESFKEAMDRGWERLLEANGGPPPLPRMPVDWNTLEDKPYVKPPEPVPFEQTAAFAMNAPDSMFDANWAARQLGYRKDR